MRLWLWFGFHAVLFWDSLHPFRCPVLFAFSLLTFLFRALLVASRLLFWCFTFSSSWHLSFRVSVINSGLMTSSICDSLSGPDACFLLPWHQPWFYSCSALENKLGQITLLTGCMTSVGFLKIGCDLQYLYRSLIMNSLWDLVWYPKVNSFKGYVSGKYHNSDMQRVNHSGAWLRNCECRVVDRLGVLTD